jgi:predicted ArsR family transcriptional regulator
MWDEGVQDEGPALSGNKVSVYEAANVLGVTVDAVRKRIQRGTIPHKRDDNGRVWVLLNASSTIPDNVQDIYRAVYDELVDELREQISHLREILREEQDARRRADAIIAQFTRANAGLAPLVPELQASPEEPTLPVGPPAGARGDSGGREESRWRRLFQG